MRPLSVCYYFTIVDSLKLPIPFAQQALEQNFGKPYTTDSWDAWPAFLLERQLFEVTRAVIALQLVVVLCLWACF